MKRKRVLLGLILAASMGTWGVCHAQSNANYQQSRLIEIGPDNIGGRTRALVATAEDGHAVLYAGGVAGGLYTKTTGNWSYIPYYENNEEVTLPITDMVKTPNNKILIATGEGYYAHGVTNVAMAPKGYGLFVFDPAAKNFTKVEVTNPSSHPEFSYINRVAYTMHSDTLYLYVSTTEGLYRWKVNQNVLGTAVLPAPERVHEGAVQDVEMISQLNIAFFTAGNNIYKVGNVTAGSAEALVADAVVKFSDTASRIELAGNYSNGRMFLYAMVANTSGLLNGVYLTHDQQTWTKLTTSTITPFTTAATGWTSNSITIDPYNHSRIFIGGATLWVGQGFIENSNYMWNKVTYSENELNAGNYMGSVYTETSFVHSGINAIVPYITDSANYKVTYYMATDGGIYVTKDDFTTFGAINKGFNVAQYNSIAVAPDGSVLGGAYNNAVPFVQSRMDHNGGTYDSTWYDNAPNRMNHIGNILWLNDGSDVAVSMFQQVKPQERRGIFVSSNGGRFGRSYADYSDFTNTQTWTINDKFVSDKVANGPELPKMLLWETTNNTSWNDSITFTIDTLGEVIRDGSAVTISGDFLIHAGDKVMVPSVAHFNYPIEYTFPTSFVAKDKMTHKIANPIASRIFVSAYDGAGKARVWMNCTPTDYRKVYDTTLSQGSWMNWVAVYRANDNFKINNIAISNDADVLFINVSNTKRGTNSIYRLRNLSGSNANSFSKMDEQLSFESDLAMDKRITPFDTLYNSGKFEFTRPITSMTTDKRDGKDVLIVTFGGDDANESNLCIVTNASKENYSFSDRPVDCSSDNFAKADPLYSALVEYTTGEVFVGSEKGVFTTPASTLYAGNSSWTEYGAFTGVPVKSIYQQTASLKSQRYYTHTGVNVDTMLFAKTKYPYALYFGTYGRGIFVDTSYVTDHENEIVDSAYWVGITNVTVGTNSVRIYPNPASDRATLDITLTNDAAAVVNVYDLSGRMVYSKNLGTLSAGTHAHQIDCGAFHKGMYLVNVVAGKQAAASKLIVR